MLVGAVLFSFTLLGCVTESELPVEPETAEAQQAVTIISPTCRVNGGASTVFVCFNEGTSFVGFDTIVRADAPPTSVPNPVYVWVRRSSGGLLVDRGGCGPSDDFCAVSIRPGCDPENANRAFADQTAKFVDFAVGILPAGSPANTLPTEAGTVKGLVPNGSNCSRPAQQSACLPPANPPVLGIFSERCGGLHSIRWGTVPNASNYQVQTKPRVGFSDWNQISDIPSFPGITVDVPGQSCRGDANGDFLARVRACNDCGCSAWGSQAQFNYFHGECS